MAMQTFVNVPVKDLKKAREFFTSVDFSFDDQFTDEQRRRARMSIPLVRIRHEWVTHDFTTEQEDTR